MDYSSVSTHPDKDEYLGVPNPVLALRHPDHGELAGTLALLNQLPHLGTNLIMCRMCTWQDAIFGVQGLDWAGWMV